MAIQWGKFERLTVAPSSLDALDVEASTITPRRMANMFASRQKAQFRPQFCLALTLLEPEEYRVLTPLP